MSVWQVKLDGEWLRASPGAAAVSSGLGDPVRLVDEANPTTIGAGTNP